MKKIISLMVSTTIISNTTVILSSCEKINKLTYVDNMNDSNFIKNFDDGVFLKYIDLEKRVLKESLENEKNDLSNPKIVFGNTGKQISNNFEEMKKYFKNLSLITLEVNIEYILSAQGKKNQNNFDIYIIKKVTADDGKYTWNALFTKTVNID
ncbi:hypothetical protein [Spiroplasma tabanidicola]|uniref:Lipoprotein n=1 Tax=Spiroplasma tabanidicola TaxID=324079 RepID=A0A6I6C9B1_9MOLU|nr:hypothetical protein [Spiroplasma tabanidicola]QGS52186.1 hypothetical protein STABA_v1c08310 [Spiroplasma tabanidicola]